MPNAASHDDADARTTRIVCKLLFAILAADTFDNFTDLRDALWSRCRQLRIPATVAIVDDALRRVGSHTPLLGDIRRDVTPPVAGSPNGPISQAQAATILRRLGLDVSPTSDRASWSILTRLRGIPGAVRSDTASQD